MEHVLIKIRLLRKLYGYSQAYLALTLSVSQSAYSKKESGQVMPTLTDLEKIAGVFGITLTDLLSQQPEWLLQETLRINSPE